MENIILIVIVFMAICGIISVILEKVFKSNIIELRVFRLMLTCFTCICLTILFFIDVFSRENIFLIGLDFFFLVLLASLIAYELCILKHKLTNCKL